MELIVVIAVIGILAAVLIPTFSGAFTSANLAADRGDASNMTRILRTAYPAGIPDNIEAPEIRAAVSAEAEFSFVPRSAADGYTFWYDRARQEITVGKASELPASAGAAGHNAPSLEEVIPGYLMVDVGGNRVADLLASFRNLLSLDEYNTLKAGAEALKDDLPAGFTAEQVDALVEHLVGEDNPDNFSPEHNLYINDFGSFTTAKEGVVTRMIFSDGITMISAVSATVTAVRNDIVVPSSVSFVEEGAFAAIRQTEEDGETIETNLIFRDADIKVESNEVFSDYLLEKNPGLAKLPPMRAEPVGEVEFEITFDQPTAEKKGWTIQDGFYLKTDTVKTEDGAEQTVGTTQYRPFRLTINPQVTGEDDQIYISDTWRFRYQNLPDGSVAVQVKLFDAEGVVGEDTITYRVPETLDLQFKDSTLRFAELTSALGFAEKTGQKVTYTLKVGETSYTFYKGIVQDLQNIQGLSEGTSESVGTIAWLREQGYIDNTNALTEKGETLQAALSMSGLFGEFNFGTEKPADSMSDIAFLLGTDGWKAYLDRTDGSERAELSYENGTWKNGSGTVPEEDLGLIYFERVSTKEGTSSPDTKVSGKLTTVTTATNPSTITYTLKKASAADVEAYGTNGPVVGDLIMISQESGTRQTITNVQVDIDENGTPENDLGFTRVQFIEYHTFNYFLAAVYGVDEKQWQFDGKKDLTLEVKVGDEVVIRQTLNDAKPESESTISQTIANQENTSYQYEFSYRTTYEPETSSPILEMGKMEVKIANVSTPYSVSLYSKEEYESHQSDPGYNYFHNGITEGGVTEGGKGDYEIVGFDSSGTTAEPQTATLTWHINFANLKYKFAKDSPAYNTFDNIQATDAMTNRAPYEINYQIKEASPETFYLTYLNGRQVSQAGDSANPIVLAKGETLLESSQTYGVSQGAGTIYFNTTVRPIDNLPVNVLEITGWPEANAAAGKKGILTVRYYPDGVGNSLYAETELHYEVGDPAGSASSLAGTMAQINGREVGAGQTFFLTEGEGISLTNNTRMYYFNGGSAVSVYFNSANADYGAGSNRQKLIVEYSPDGSSWRSLTQITTGDKTYTSGTPLTRPGESYNVSAEQLLELPETLEAGITGKLRFTYVFRCNLTGGSYGTNLEEAVAFRGEVAFEIVPKSSVNHLALRLDYQSAEPDQTGNNVITVTAGAKISRLNAAYGSYLQFINAQGVAQTCYLYAKAPYSTTAYKPDDYLVNVKLDEKTVLGSGQGWSVDSSHTVTEADNGKILTYTVNFYGVEYSASATLRVVSDRPVRLMSLNGIRYYDGLVYAFAPGDTLIAGSPTQIYYSYTASYEAGFSMPTTESATNYMKFFLSTNQSRSSDDAEWERGQTFEAAWNSWTNQGKEEGQQYYLIIRAMSSNTLFEDIAVPFTYSGSNQTVEAQVYAVNSRTVLTYGKFEVLHNEGLWGSDNYLRMTILNPDGTVREVAYSAALADSFKVYVKYGEEEYTAVTPQLNGSSRTFAFDASKGTSGMIKLEYTEGSTTYTAEAPFRVSGIRVRYINNRSYAYKADDAATSILTADGEGKTVTTTLTEPFLFYKDEVFQPFAMEAYIGAHRSQTYAEGLFFASDGEDSWRIYDRITKIKISVTDEQKGNDRVITPSNYETTVLPQKGYLKFEFTIEGKTEAGKIYAAKTVRFVQYLPFEVSDQTLPVLTDEELSEYGLTDPVVKSRIYRVNARQTDNSQSMIFYDGEQIALHTSYSATSMAIFAPDGRRRELNSAATNGLNLNYGDFTGNYGTNSTYGIPGYNEYWLIKVTMPGEGQTADAAFRKLGLDPNYVGATASELIRANYLDHVFRTGESGVLVWVREQYGITYAAEIAYTVKEAEPLNGQDWEDWFEEEIADLTWDKRDTNLEAMLVIEQSMEVTWFAGPDGTTEPATVTETREIPYKFTRYTFDKGPTAYVLREWNSDIHSKSVKNEKDETITCYVALYDQTNEKLITEISDSMRSETAGASVTLVYVNRDTGEIVQKAESPAFAELSLQMLSSVTRGDAYSVDTAEAAAAVSYKVKVLKTPTIKSDAQVGIVTKINGTDYPFHTGAFTLDGDTVAVDSASAVKVLTRNGYYTNVNFSDKFRYFVKGAEGAYTELTVSDGRLDLSAYDSGTLKVVLYYYDIYYVAEREFVRGEAGTYRVTNVNGRNPQTASGDAVPVFTMAENEAITSAYGTWSRENRPDSTLYFSGLTSVSTAWTYYFYAREYEADWTIPEVTESDTPLDMMTWKVEQNGYLVVSYTSGMTMKTAIYLEIRDDFEPTLNPASIRLSLRSAANAEESPFTFTPEGGDYGIEDPNLLVLSAEDGILATTGTYVRFTRPDGTVSTAYASESNLENGNFRLYLQGEEERGEDSKRQLTLGDLLRAETAGKALLEPTLKATREGSEETLYGQEAAKYYSRYSETNSQITDEDGNSWTEGEARIEITRKAEVKEDGSCTMTVTEKYYPAGAEQGAEPTKTTETVYTVRYYAVKLIIEYDDYGITYRGEWNLVVLA